MQCKTCVCVCVCVCVRACVRACVYVHIQYTTGPNLCTLMCVNIFLYIPTHNITEQCMGHTTVYMQLYSVITLDLWSTHVCTYIVVFCASLQWNHWVPMLCSALWKELEVLETHFIMLETHYFTCTMPASQGERIHVSLLNDTHESY